MRGIKGTVKTYGDPCAMCKAPLTVETAKPRVGRPGLNSYCRACLNKRAKDRHWQNPDARRAAIRTRNAELKAQVIKAYGGMCECCGETAPEFLALDHRNGGGTQHRKTVLNPTAMRRLVIRERFPPQYRILCHNCNCALGWFGRCPHQSP